jgi:ubiquinone/menaquinone biosynthesis C-methylase UbiE
MRHSGNELINPFKMLERAGLQPGWYVADLGCGALGHFVFPAAAMVGGNGRVYAVDIQKIVVKHIEHTAKQEQYWNVIPVWSDIEVLNAARIPSGSIDLTIVANNLYLCRNRAGLVKEAVRLTKPGGRLLVIEWKKEGTPIGPDLEHRMSIDEAREVFRNPQIDLLDRFEAGDYHYALLYARHEREPQTEVLAVSHAMSD